MSDYKYEAMEIVPKLTKTTELREMDAWLAEHVMGWEKVATPIENLLPNQFCMTEDEGLLVASTGDEPNSIYFEQWHPTEEGSAAMEVLNKCLDTMKRKNEVYGIEITIQNRCGNFNICCNSPNHSLHETEAETVKLSICQFAKSLFSK